MNALHIANLVNKTKLPSNVPFFHTKGGLFTKNSV